MEYTGWSGWNALNIKMSQWVELCYFSSKAEYNMHDFVDRSLLTKFVDLYLLAGLLQQPKAVFGLFLLSN